MTRYEAIKGAISDLENQRKMIIANFGKSMCPAELEQKIAQFQNELDAAEAVVNRQKQFVRFTEGLLQCAGLEKISDFEGFRKKSLYDDEVTVKYDGDYDPNDSMRVRYCTTNDYTIAEISVYYKRSHNDTHEVESKQRVLFKVSHNHFSFNDEAYDQLLKFIRVNADEAVSYLREAELRWTLDQIRSVFAQKGITETTWTPAESELNI
jgi:hypothetical protein